MASIRGIFKNDPTPAVYFLNSFHFSHCLLVYIACFYFHNHKTAFRSAGMASSFCALEVPYFLPANPVALLLPLDSHESSLINGMLSPKFFVHQPLTIMLFCFEQLLHIVNLKVKRCTKPMALDCLFCLSR